MVINTIKLNNFGSYEGENEFDTRIINEKNIVVFGGKNGAGKTTLFTAIRLCLYGFASMGYKSKNSYYFKSITKLINNAAKIKKPTCASVSLNISITNGNEKNVYEIIRSWNLDSSLTEKFSVLKNNEILEDEETANFEKYILNILSPELFNLYFFDGEKIADFFLEGNGGERIKNAFLTLCGYDVFEIMKKNFKRTCASQDEQNELLDEYLRVKEALFDQEKSTNEIKAEVEDCIANIQTCDLNLEMLEKEFVNSGGISEKEWESEIGGLKDEENKRAILNSSIKKWANDVIPFLIVKEMLDDLDKQITLENDEKKIKHFIEFFEESNLQKKLEKEFGTSVEKINSIISDYVKAIYSTNSKSILSLSDEQVLVVKSNIKRIKEFDVSQIETAKKEIRKSIKKSANIRKKLENSNTNSAQSYLNKRNELLELKAELLQKQAYLKDSLIENENLLEIVKHKYETKKKTIEDQIKKQSIADISAKSIIMLDNLQDILYHKQIRKVESNFKKVINTLMYKMDFIDDIHIDDNFNIHVYRYETIECDKAVHYLENRTLEEAQHVVGKAAIDFLVTFTKQNEIKKMIDVLRNDKRLMMIPIEIDKSSLSNGEKQIFIMSLYYSMMQISNKEMPFIIDTPFARIDTQHRRNISKHFFSELNGQVFILSTDEEINNSHMKIMRDKISRTYMLENPDNKRTIISKDMYFEV